MRPLSRAWLLAALILLPAWAAALAPSTSHAAHEWLERRGGVGSYHEGGWRAAASPDGQTLFVGGTSGLSSLWDSVTAMLVVALDAATGETMWEARHLGPEQHAALYDLAVAPDGAFVVAAGAGFDSALGPVVAVVAYDAGTGALLWEATLPPEAHAGEARAVAVSPDGSRVAVAAATHCGLGCSSDATLALLDAATGGLVWLHRHDGLARGSDAATAMAFAPDGRALVVAGATESPVTGADVLVAAHDIATGAPLWTITRDGGALGDDHVAAVAIDPAGARAVVAAGARGLLSGAPVGLALGLDLATGAPLWARSPVGGLASELRDLVLAPDGSAVHLAGAIATADAPGGVPLALTLDAATGLPLWQREVDVGDASAAGATSIARSSDGARLVLAGGAWSAASGWDALSAGLSAATGEPTWLHVEDAAGGWDLARDVVVAGSSTFVVGESFGADHVGFDVAAQARDVAKGERLWRARHDVAAEAIDEARAATLTADGALVLVAGATWGVGSGMDMLAVALDAATGAPRWQVGLDGARRHDHAFAVAATPDGALVLVAGSMQTLSAREDAATIALDARDGSIAWKATYDGPGKHYDVATAVAVTPDGERVITAAESWGGASGLDVALLAHDARTGALLWATRIEGAPGAYDETPWLALSADGARAVVAYTTRPSAASDGDVALAVVDVATGALASHVLWTEPRDARATALELSADGGRAYVVGSVAVDAGDRDQLTLAFDVGTSAWLWSARLDRAQAIDFATAVALSPDGARVFVTGSTRDGCPLVFSSASAAPAAPEFPTAAPGAPAQHPFAPAPAAAQPPALLDQCGIWATTTAYDAATGARLWRADLGRGAGEEMLRTPTIGVSPDGTHVLVTAPRHAEPVNPFDPNRLDVVTSAIDAATGATSWTSSYEGPRGRLDVPIGVLVGRERAIVVATDHGLASLSDVAALAYSQAQN